MFAVVINAQVVTKKYCYSSSNAKKVKNNILFEVFLDRKDELKLLIEQRRRDNSGPSF